MNYIKIAIGFIGLSISISACQEKNLLDKYPLDQVTDVVFFTQPNDMKIYLNQFYNRSNFPLASWDLGDLDSDIHYFHSSINTRLEGTSTINSGPNLTFTDIRSVNYFFDNYKKCTADFDSYKQYVGEAYFFRAFFYFKLLKDFGDVQWETTVLKTTSTELYDSRDLRNIVADNIIANLDSAAIYLTADKTNGYSRINKWIALLFQSRVALYEGTWQKYHAKDIFGASNTLSGKYFDKVVVAAGAVMNSGLYEIYNTGSPKNDYVDLFGLRDYSENKEVMFWSKMRVDLGIFAPRQLDYMTYPMGVGITKALTDSYLCTDGLPISKSPLFKGFNTIADEAKNRDPRFYQTIFTPESPWLIQNGVTTYWSEVYDKLFSNNDFTASTGYQRRKHYNPNMDYHQLNFEETPSIQFRYAEALLNFAEAKAELGSITQGDLNNSINKLRDRVEMPHLSLGIIANDPNWEFPELSPLINEIRRERKIELALEGFRFNDIARWAAADELIIGKRPKGAKASQFKIAPPYPVDANGFIDPLGAALPGGWGFKIGRDYLYPIPESELVLNPNLKQNPGW